MDIKIAPSQSLDVQLVMTGRGCVIGQSGSGKSFLVGTIAEKLSALNLPFCIVDTEGEYSQLKDYFNAIVVGGPNKDFDFAADLSDLFRNSIKDGVPILMDLSDETDKKEKVYRALEQIYKLEEKLRLPYLILIEESDKFVPQIMHNKVNIIEELGVRGRKRGIGLIVATQRPSNISKNLLSQCSYGFIGKLTIANDLNAVSHLFSDKRKLKEIVNLKLGEFIPFGIGSNNMFKVNVTDVSTIKGSTPTVDTKVGKGQRLGPGQIISKLRIDSNFSKKPKIKLGRRIWALSLKFSNHDAHVYSLKVAKRRFGVFGAALERPESIKLKYTALGLCKIRLPTKRKNEFEEYSFFIDRNYKLVKLFKGVFFKNGGIQKPIRLDEMESRLLAEIKSKGKIKISSMDKLFAGHEKALASALRELLQHKLATKDKNNLYAENYRPYLLKENPNMEAINIPSDQAGEEITKERAKLYISNLYPNATIVSVLTVYMPVHEIVLRYKNKIRIFRIDGIYGKELVTD